ncbi:MAG: 4-(cytidine 5'-diphospho)-2-C-methyl-D-erythritol kinase [Acidobacteriota bacterium]
MRARAYAKVNLGLEVLFRRKDGYHELRTILQTVDLYDRLEFQVTAEGVELVTSDPKLPTGLDNLVVKATRMLARETGSSQGIHIVLEKHIPVGRGLGGGSADAAMTLLALNELWGAGLAPRDLHRLAAQVGVDVPFFLCGGTALGVGRGEEVYPLARQFKAPIVLILPEFAIDTAEAYQNLILTNRDSAPKLQYFALPCRAREEELLDLANDLETAAGEHSPSIHGYKQTLIELGATGALMSGSGSAVFGIFHDAAVALSAARSLASGGVPAIATRTITQEEYREKTLES